MAELLARCRFWNPRWRILGVTRRRLPYFTRPLFAIGVWAVLTLLNGCDAKDRSSGPSTSAPPTPVATTPSTSATNAAMVSLPGGKFLMGTQEEVDAPPHEVTLSPFAIDRYLVTQQLYQRVMGENPSRWKVDLNPVEQVRWSDAVRFCNQRSKQEGLEPCYDLQTWACNFKANGYRLPTEAEWEYACRAGSTTGYYFDATPARLGEFAWYDRNSGGHPHPVGQKRRNAWGLYDMCGNVWQWCHDLYQVDYYPNSPPLDPRGPTEGRTRVVRGGAWRTSEQNCRSGYRYYENPGYADVCFGYDIYGFRCVKKVAPSTATPASDLPINRAQSETPK